MTAPGDNKQASAREGRMIAIVIAAAGLGWLGALWAGPKLGLHENYALLFDLAALAAFFWALVATWRIWRRQASPPK